MGYEERDPWIYAQAQSAWEQTYRRVRSPSWMVRWRNRVIWLLLATVIAAFWLVFISLSWLTAWAILLAVVGLAGWIIDSHMREHEESVLERHRFRLCTSCHYPLEGLPPQGRCPECGLEFHIHDVEAFWQGYLQCLENLRKHAPISEHGEPGGAPPG